MREEDEYSEAETVIDEPTLTSQGDAILALKQAVARRNTYCVPGTYHHFILSLLLTSSPTVRLLTCAKEVFQEGHRHHTAHLVLLPGTPTYSLPHPPCSSSIILMGFLPRKL